MNKAAKTSGRWVICVDNAGYEAALEKGKVYRCVPDRDAPDIGLVRIVDESGDDYLYGAKRFAPILLAPSVSRKLTRNGPSRKAQRLDPRQPPYQSKARNGPVKTR